MTRSGAARPARHDSRRAACVLCAAEADLGNERLDHGTRRVKTFLSAFVLGVKLGGSRHPEAHRVFLQRCMCFRHASDAQKALAESAFGGRP